MDELSEAIKRGRSKGLAQITNSLFESAMNGTPAAQIFYLKNMAPEQWADVQSIKVQVNVSKLSDSQLLEELRQDPAILQTLKHVIPQLEH